MPLCHENQKSKKSKNIIKRVCLRGKKGSWVMNKNKVFDLCGSRVRAPLFRMGFFVYLFCRSGCQFGLEKQKASEKERYLEGSIAVLCQCRRRRRAGNEP